MKHKAAPSSKVGKIAASTTTASKKSAPAKAQPAKKASKPAPSTRTTTTKKAAPAKKAAPEKAPAKKAAAPEKAPTKKAAPAPALPKPTANMKRKRDSGVDETQAPVVKKPKIAINSAPTEKLNVYVCGEGGNGELGLGTEKAVNVRRPRLNPKLAAEHVGVVQIAAGGMHSLALTHDGKVYSWGINDQGTLGRDTTKGEVLKDMNENPDEDQSDDDDESESAALNELEATPAPIPSDAFPEGTKIVQVSAGDSSSWALTDDGLVYGWGQFRVSHVTNNILPEIAILTNCGQDSNGIFGFMKNKDGTVIDCQRTPLLIPTLKDIVQIEAGQDHVLALDKSGSVWAWGCGDNGQIGRRFMERRKYDSLEPGRVALPKGKVASIHTGMSHSFAVMKDGSAYSWGLNNFGQCGIPGNAGEDSATLFKPEKIKSMPEPIESISGGNMHSIALAKSGNVLVFGRLDTAQAGMEIDSIPEESIKKNEHDKPAILLIPTVNPNVPSASFVTAGGEHCIAITKEGKLYTWGFNANYQLGNGDAEGDDVVVAELIENTAVKDKKLTSAGAGGQFSLFAGPAQQ